MVALALTVYKLTFIFLHPLAVSPDQALYLETGKLILQGEIPYLDFFDFNLPLIMYLSVIPVVVAKLPGLDSLPLPLVFNLSIELFFLGSFAVLLRLMRQSKGDIPASFSFPFLLVYACFNQSLTSDFGQREHLFLLAFVPWLLYRTVSTATANQTFGRRLGTGLAFLASLGLALKPQFLIFALFLEGTIYLWRKGRLFDSDLKSLGLFYLAINISSFLLPFEAWRIYFQQALPLYFYGSSWSAKSFMHCLCGFDYFYYPILLLFAALLLYLTGAWQSLPLLLRRLGFANILMALVGLLHYLAGGQAWTYRILPLQLFGLLALFCLLYALLDSLWSRYCPIEKLRTLIPGAVCLLALYLTGFKTVQEILAVQSAPLFKADGCVFANSPLSDLDSSFLSISSNSAAGQSVLTISSGIRPAYPAQLQANRQPGSRYLYFPLMMLLQASHSRKDEGWRKHFQRMEERMISELGNDIVARKPTLIYLQLEPIGAELSRFGFIEKYLHGYSLLGYCEGSAVYKLQQ
ncbi:MAG: hypothetical protein K2Y32_01770 [Candidatus Obscuribacterales bacterium]|nr:hypothetical protein [Candidatus Obscuribacterales bacterium]